ncbi:knob-associated histidine-rich protein-like [Vespula pensylvanica]|uniref:knob-associated histidine-rich protein-like n=1 Tax=Vespula pensylvanica TaxID=30213 RepID=UPI001CBA41D1|nr:knob-associated histidine-rich protein-like [Vespula pensylvanica]XP_050869694.1 knob-associated histidine-rich protein-like [Vespula vulgaris]
MSMPTKGKQQHHLAHHHHHHQQQHHNPHQQHPLVVNVNVNNPGVHHLSQGYSTVVATSTPRYISNAETRRVIIHTLIRTSSSRLEQGKIR